MNPWTMLLIGFVLGWLIEFAVDWFYWRRKTPGEKEIEDLQEQLQAAEMRITELETGTAATGEDDDSDYGEEELESGDWDAEEEMADGEIDSAAEDSEFAEAAAAAGIAAVVLSDEDDESPVDEFEIEAAADLENEILAEDSDFGDDDSAGAEDDMGSAAKIAAVGVGAAAVAAVAAGLDDDSDSEEPELEAAVGLDDEILIADSDLGEDDSAEGGIGSAAKIAAVGAAAAVAAGMDDDSDIEESELEAAADLDDEILTDDSDLGEDDSAEGGIGPAAKIAAVGAAAAVVAGMDDDSDPEESELTAANLDDEILAEDINSANEEAAKRMVSGAAASSRDLSYVEGIGPVYAAKLKEAGVDTPQALLERGATNKGRQALAKETGISGHLILTWINQADLYRIKGLGQQYADLLEASGVDTVVELAQRNPQNLYQKMSEVNEAKQLVRQLPSQGQVENWVSQAKQLPRVITY